MQERSDSLPADITGLNPLEALRPTFGGIAERARQITKEVTEIQTPEGQLALSCSIAQAALLRPLLAQFSGKDSALLDRVGGPEGNRVIDVAGGELIRAVVEADVEDTGQRIRLRIEEVKRWEDVTPQGIPTPRGEHLLLVDPVDETEAIKDELHVQSVGILATRPDGSFAAAAIASLVPADRRILLIEGKSVYRLFYNEQNETILPSLPLIAPTWRIGDRLRVATLPRRIPALRKTPLFEGYGDRIDIVPTFGGFALLGMLMPMGERIHAMIDIQKGQPWYEPWGIIAQQAGFIVRGRNTNPLPFEQLIRFAYEHEGNARIPQVICELQNIYDFIGPQLKPVRSALGTNVAP